MRKNTRETRRGGFTLLEVLLVVGIIGILAGMIVVAANAVARSSRKQATGVLLSRIEAAVDQYNEIHGTAWMEGTVPTRAQVGLDTWLDDGEAPAQSVVDMVQDANHAIAQTVLMGQDSFEFAREGAKYPVIVEDAGSYYVVDAWYNADDPDRDLDNHMIWFAREGIDPVVDIWCTGPDGQTDVLRLSHSQSGADARDDYGDDIVNWSTGN